MRESWGSRFGFIMATAGFAVGLGNIWRFPYMTGVNGGGAFLLVYLAMTLLIGIPLMMIEVGLGRRAQLSPIAGMTALTGSRTSPWNAIAWLGIITAVAINAYYVMLIGWILGYFLMTVGGQLDGQSGAELQTTFEAFTAAPVPVIGYTLVSIAVMMLVISRGLTGGLERLARVAMPLLLGLLVVLAARSMMLPGAMRGLEWYLTPDFSVIDSGVLLAALGQAFFSIGIGMAAAFSFGSYLKRDRSNVPGSVAIVVAFDTGVAVLAGLVMFPALFAFDLEPNAGPGLLFVTMPNLFAQMPGGWLFGTSFFFLLILAGLTSALAIFEVVVTTIVDSAGLSRTRATIAAGGLWAVLSTLVILGEGPWSTLQIAGLTIFGAIDAVTSNYFLPIGGLLLVLYTVFVWGFGPFRDEVNVGAGRFRVTNAMRPLVVVVIPVAVAIVLLISVGLL